MKKDIRATQIDLDKCVELAGNNRFNLILAAAQRLRELRAEAKTSGTSVTTVDPLLEVQRGQVDVNEYLLKLHSK
mgnify:CR=1 FL=1